jgi:peroxiredoxin Q/BCP
MLQVGERAPDFEAVLDDGRPFRLSKLRGDQNVVLYFYPRDFSGGCTAQACSFRDNYADIRKLDATIIGVSVDSSESHQRFKERHHLSYPIISDIDGHLRELYDVKSVLPKIRPRVTYVIDKHGIIRGAFRHDILVTKHISDAVKVLKEIEAAPAR